MLITQMNYKQTQGSNNNKLNYYSLIHFNTLSYSLRKIYVPAR